MYIFVCCFFNKIFVLNIFFADLPHNLLDRKITLCEELLDVASILAPGLSRFRECILSELSDTLKVKADRGLKDKNINQNEVPVIYFYKCK